MRIVVMISRDICHQIHDVQPNGKKNSIDAFFLQLWGLAWDGVKQGWG